MSWIDGLKKLGSALCAPAEEPINERRLILVFDTCKELEQFSRWLHAKGYAHFLKEGKEG
jgi:hypothetical protein